MIKVKQIAKFGTQGTTWWINRQKNDPFVKEVHFQY